MDGEGDDLIRRFRDGDEDAFRALVEVHVKALEAGLARRIPGALRRRVAVSDVVQEGLLVAFRRRADFEDRGPDGFRRWLGGIVDLKLHEAIRHHGGASKRSAAREVTRSARAATEHAVGRTPSPSAAAASAETSDHVRAAMASLPEDHRTILTLALIDGLSLGDAAERMGRSREAAKKLYGRAMVGLRAALAARAGSDRDA